MCDDCLLYANLWLELNPNKDYDNFMTLLINIPFPASEITKMVLVLEFEQFKTDPVLHQLGNQTGSYWYLAYNGEN